MGTYFRQIYKYHCADADVSKNHDVKNLMVVLCQKY